MTQASLDLDLDDGGETFTVGELADALNSVLRREFGDGLWVRGEIQGYSERGAHAYFRLVETRDDGTKAVLDVGFFANVRMRLRPVLQRYRLQLTDGMKVRVYGVVDFYAANGRLSLKMAGIDPRYTLGELAMERDEVIRRLVADGLYDTNRRLAVAELPLRVGLVTSRDSAAWHDFMHQLKQSGHGFGIRVVDVRVQGDDAVAMVTDAIEHLARRGDVDVIVIIRGGGSRTELAVFDAESIARAIASSPVPVFTGLGHEIDRSVADEVAHSAFKTPTACAVALIERVNAFAARAELAWTSIEMRVSRHVEQASRTLVDAARRIEQSTVGAAARADERLVDRSRRVAAASIRRLDRASESVARAAQRVAVRPLQHTVQQLSTLTQLDARVRSLDPQHTLARGWSITRTADGRVVRAALSLARGDEIVTRFAMGEASSRIESTRTNDDDQKGITT